MTARALIRGRCEDCGHNVWRLNSEGHDACARCGRRISEHVARHLEQEHQRFTPTTFIQAHPAGAGELTCVRCGAFLVLQAMPLREALRKMRRFRDHHRRCA